MLPVLVIVNNAVVDVGVQIALKILISVLLDKNSEVGLLDHMPRFVFVFF